MREGEEAERQRDRDKERQRETKRDREDRERQRDGERDDGVTAHHDVISLCSYTRRLPQERSDEEDLSASAVGVGRGPIRGAVGTRQLFRCNKQ